MRLLIASIGAPTASGKGYQVRLYNQVLGLSERHDITLLTFGSPNEVDSRLSNACRKIVSIPDSAARAAAAAALNAPRLPLSVGLYRRRAMVGALAAEIRDQRYDLVLLQLVRMAPYLHETAGLPSVLDLLDAAELSMRERARAAGPGARQIFELEAGRLGRYERQAINSAALSLVISQRDFEYLGRPPKARVLPNGIDPPERISAPTERAAATIAFTGTMSYFPNADAVIWFADEVLPLVKRSVPSAEFQIVGREPTRAVRALAARPGVTVTGSVADMSQELARVTVSVCPMRFGSGMQTKILEAMAASTPVVGTTKALEGIPADLRLFASCADSPQAFAAEVVRVLTDPSSAFQRAVGGLEAIRARHTWRHSVSQLEELLDQVVAAAR